MSTKFRWSIKQAHPLSYIITLLLFSLAGCRAASPVPTPTVVEAVVLPTITPTAAPQESPTATSTPEVHAASAALTNTLPAPLYYLNVEGQIMRLAADRSTLTQITNEPAGITDYDHSVAHGRFAWVSNNQLWEYDPTNNQRMLKSDGGELTYPSSYKEASNRIHALHYSPDGTTIAYLQDANVMLINSGVIEAGSAQEIMAAIPYQEGQPNAAEVREYRDITWLPSSRQLVATTALWEGSTYTLYNLDSATATEFSPFMCCGLAWSQNEQALLVIHNLYGAFALYRVDPITAVGQKLFASEDSGVEIPTIQQFNAPFVGDDGQLYALGTITATYQAPLSIYRFDQATSQWERVSQATIHASGETLWSSDASSLLHVNSAFALQTDQPLGELLWLKRDEAEPQALNLHGRQLRWGTPQDLPLDGTASSFPVPEQGDWLQHDDTSGQYTLLYPPNATIQPVQDSCTQFAFGIVSLWVQQLPSNAGQEVELCAPGNLPTTDEDRFIDTLDIGQRSYEVTGRFLRDPQTQNMIAKYMWVDVTPQLRVIVGGNWASTHETLYWRDLSVVLVMLDSLVVK